MSTFIFAICILFSLVLAFSALRSKRSGAEDFFVGSRQFGTALIFFLAAGEIYSIGSIAGFPGGIYAGGPAYGIWYLGYILMAYPIGYFLVPRIWEAGKHYNSVTLPDLFSSHYQSRGLELVVAITGALFLLPWGQLQFTGLMNALKGLGWTLPPVYLLSASALLAFCYIATSGVRSSAYVAVFKDIMMILAVVITGIAVCSTSSVGAVFHAAAAHTEARMTNGQLTFAVTTIIFQALGFFMMPFNAQSMFAASSANTIRRSQALMPLYMLMFPFLVLVAYYSLAVNTQLSSPNAAFFTAARELLPESLLGIVTAGACLSGLLVLSVISLSIGSIVTRNLMPGHHVVHQRRTTRIVILVYLIASIILTLMTPNLMTTLINTAYFGVTQFFPGVFGIAILRRRLNPVAIGAGILVGQGLAIALYLGSVNTGQINIGLIGLIANIVTVAVVQAFASSKAKSIVKVEFDTAT